MNPSFRVLLTLAVLFPTLLLAAAPVVTDPTAVPGASGTATLSAKVTSNGAASAVTFRYGLTPAYGSTATGSAPASAVAQTVTVPLANLVGGRTYHYQVLATNADGASPATADATFAEPVYAPRLTLESAVTVAATATLKGRVTANGTSGGEAYFQYGLTNAYGTETAHVAVAAGDIDKPVTGNIAGLVRNTTYHYRLVFNNAGVIAPVTSDATFLTNRAPVAATDNYNLSSAPTTIIPVLRNDSDPDGDAITLVSTERPQHGTAQIVGNSVHYTPGADFTGSDTFDYQIRDAFGLTATGTINAVSLLLTVAGARGGFIKSAEGKEVGYFRIVTNELGTFTGHIVINGERYSLAGFFSLNGTYSGTIYANGEALTVSLRIALDGDGTSIQANFGGRWTADVNATPIDATTRIDVTGRYTATLPGGTSATISTDSGGTVTTDPGTDVPDPGTPVIPGPTTPVATNATLIPAGTGWVAFKVREDGTAKVKGTLPDGRKFSTRGVIESGTGGATVLTFYRDMADTRVVANLTLGDTVTGTVHVDRGSSNAEHFPEGFDATFNATGAPYLKPEKGQRALDVAGGGEHDRMSVVISGGGLDSGLTLPLVLSEKDKVSVDIPESRGLRMKIDRESGRFTLREAGIGVKGTGVLIQSSSATSGGGGAGLFKGNGQTGTITLSVRQ